MPLRERTRPGLGIIKPCLPSPAKAPPSGPGWLHEIKPEMTMRHTRPTAYATMSQVSSIQLSIAPGLYSVGIGDIFPVLSQ